MVRIVLAVVPLAVALIVTPVAADTGLVFTANVTLCAPAGITTLEGTEATAGLLLARLTSVLYKTGALKCTVPVELEPPMIGLGAAHRKSGRIGLSRNARSLP